MAHGSGGRICEDPKQVDKIRSIGKEMIKIIGKKIISGDFNLTKIPFPIKAMVPKSALESVTLASTHKTMQPARSQYSPWKQLWRKTRKSVCDWLLPPSSPLSTTWTYFWNQYNAFKIAQPHHRLDTCRVVPRRDPSLLLTNLPPSPSNVHSGRRAGECLSILWLLALLGKGWAEFYDSTQWITQLINLGHRVFEFQDGEKVVVNFPKEIFSGVFLGTLRS